VHIFDILQVEEHGRFPFFFPFVIYCSDEIFLLENAERNRAFSKYVLGEFEKLLVCVGWFTYPLLLWAS